MLILTYFHKCFFQSDAVVSISSQLNGIELFEFGDRSSNGLKSKNILEELNSCSRHPPTLNHVKRFDGKR